MSAKNDKHDKQKPSTSLLQSNIFMGNRKGRQKKRSLNECYAETKRVETETCSSFVGKKRMSARSFRAQFRPNQNMPTASSPYISKRKDGDTDPAVSHRVASKSKEPMEKEGNNNCVRDLAVDRRKECLKSFEDGAIDVGLLVSTSRSSVGVAEAELLSSSNTEETSEPPGMKPSVTSNVVRERLTSNTSFGAEVSQEIEMVNSDSMEASTGFNVLRKSNQSIDLKILDPICDLVKQHPKVVDNGVYLSPGHGIQLANQSLAVPAVGSSPSTASSLKSDDNISLPERNQDLAVERLISNKQNSIHISQTAEMEKKREILALKATTNELPQYAVSAGVQGEDQTNQDKLSHSVESLESENVVQLVTTHDLTAVAGAASSRTADNRLRAEPNHPTCSEQQHPSIKHIPLGPEFGGSAQLQAAETTHQVQKPPSHSHHQPQVRETLFESSSSDIGNPNIGNDHHSQPPISNQGGELSSGFCASFVGQPSVVDGDLVQRTSRAAMQSGNQLGLSNSHLSLQADPLQIELEKLRKGIEQFTNGHEDLKSQLRSDCQKEIAEVVAEIRRKYEAMVQDADAIFQQKQKALDKIVNKIFLNKILADSVRFSGFRRQPGSMEQLQQRPVQPTQEPADGSLSSAGTTPAAQQNIPLNLIARPRAAALSVGTSGRPPIISSISRPQTIAPVGPDICATAPYIRSIRSDFHAANPHLRVVRSYFRAVAPHLQPLRPPVSVPAPHRSLLESVTIQPLVNQPTMRPIQPPDPSP